MKTYTFTDDLGDTNELRTGKLETTFISYATDCGYDETDAVLVCSDCGGDVPCGLYYAWEPFQAGFEKGEDRSDDYSAQFDIAYSTLLKMWGGAHLPTAELIHAVQVLTPVRNCWIMSHDPQTRLAGYGLTMPIDTMERYIRARQEK